MKGERFGKPLSKREMEVLNYLPQGYTNRQIANTLSISRDTVENQLWNTYRKLGCHTRTQAVLIGIKRGLLVIK